MVMPKHLAVAAGALLLSMSAAAACDDFAEEMAMAAAVNVAEQAKASQSRPEVVAATPALAEPTSVAAVDPKPDPAQGTEAQASMLRR